VTVANRGRPTRFAGILSDDEQAWLAGTGESPRTVAEQLPPRAAVLVPRGGHGDWVRVLRNERVRVVDGAVVRRRRRGHEVLAAPGAVTSVTWIVEQAAFGVGLAPDSVGWLVLHGPEGVLAAFALSDWDAGWGAPTSSTAAVRRTGAEAFAAALGLPLAVVTDRAEAELRFGRISPERAVRLRERRPVPYIVAISVAGSAVLVGLFVPGIHTLAWAPWVLLLAAAATVARRAALLRAVGLPGWDEPPYVGPPAAGRHAPAIGVVDDELVVCDGTGWEAWMPGPQLGGVGAVLVGRDAAERPWVLLFIDRDEQVVLTLSAAAWGVADDGAERFRAASARAGLVVTGAQVDPPQVALSELVPAPVGWPPGPAIPPWRVPPEPYATVFLLVPAAVLALALALKGDWGGFAVIGCSVAGLVVATPFARIMAR
jgi:hypothetical protein